MTVRSYTFWSPMPQEDVKPQHSLGVPSQCRSKPRNSQSFILGLCVDVTASEECTRMYCLLSRVEGNIVYSQVSIFIVLSILVHVQVCFLCCFYINKLHYVYSLTFKVHSQGLFIICHHVYSHPYQHSEQGFKN